MTAIIAVALVLGVLEFSVVIAALLRASAFRQIEERSDTALPLVETLA